MSADDDKPVVLVPRIPGTGIAALVGFGLIALLGVAMFFSWRAGTLGSRMDDNVGFPGASANGPVRGVAMLPPDRVVGRVFVSGPDGAPLADAGIEDLMLEVGASHFPGVGWRWPQASGDVALVVIEGGLVEASPVSEHGLQDLRDAVEVMGLTLRVEPTE